MAELRCRAENCLYNKDNLCCKGDIMVGGMHATTKEETSCDSFTKKRSDSYTSAIEHACNTISIDCEACNCIYNSNYRCVSDKVEIRGDEACRCDQTRCGTFREME